MQEDIKLILQITVMMRTALKNSHFVHNAGWTDEQCVEEVTLSVFHKGVQESEIFFSQL
jgi:hypothetical protein